MKIKIFIVSKKKVSKSPLILNRDERQSEWSYSRSGHCEPRVTNVPVTCFIKPA